VSRSSYIYPTAPLGMSKYYHIYFHILDINIRIGYKSLMRSYSIYMLIIECFGGVKCCVMLLQLSLDDDVYVSASSHPLNQMPSCCLDTTLCT